MLCWLPDWLAALCEALAVSAPGMVGGRTCRFAQLAIERLAGHDFGLALLATEDRVLQ